MEVTLRHIRSFVAAGTLGNFTLAAKRLHLTQPGISRHVSELEKALGQPLFTRASRRVALTERGAELLRRLSAVLADLDATLTDGHPQGIHIAFAWFLPELWSSELIPEIEQRSGLHVEVSRRDDLMSALDNGECDVILWPGSIDGSGYASFPVSTDRRVAAVAAGSELAEAASVTWDQLAEHRIVVDRFDGVTGPDMWKPPIPPDRIVTGSSLGECLELIAMGRGIGTAPEICRRRAPHASVQYLDIVDAPPVIMRLVARTSRMTPELEDFCQQASSLASRA